ncbi:hypothetical protein KW800_01970 [Candidatus Parcubacteria bacterium]|nr:hypothetical protein [Candidatus Parcubacteria bacterium]
MKTSTASIIGIIALVIVGAALFMHWNGDTDDTNSNSTAASDLSSPVNGGASGANSSTSTDNGSNGFVPQAS